MIVSDRQLESNQTQDRCDRVHKSCVSCVIVVLVCDCESSTLIIGVLFATSQSSEILSTNESVDSK